MKKRRKFKFVHSSNTEVGSSSIVLCKQCSIHLTSQTRTRKKDKIYDLSCNTWPGFFWYFLTHPDLHQFYGMKLWQFIPYTWRYWWLDEVALYFRTEISRDHPESIFIDKTCDNNEWNDAINSKLLGHLSEASNKYLKPCILCPWGCSDYVHM